MSKSDLALKVAGMVERPEDETVTAVLHSYLMGSAEDRREVVELIVTALQTPGVALDRRVDALDLRNADDLRRLDVEGA